MSHRPSCIVHEFPIPEREYRAAAPAQWDKPISPSRRPAPSRARRGKRRSLLLPLVLSGLVLFVWGFLLGRTGGAVSLAASLSQTFGLSSGGPAGEPLSSPAEPSLFTLLPEEPEAEEAGPAGTPSAPGAVFSDGGDGGSAVSKDSWNLLLVNQDHPLPEDFQIPQLTQLVNGHAVDSRAYPELQRMMDDCRAEGLEPTICSSYRSWEKQTELFENKVRSCLPQAGSRREAEEQAAKWVSRPGASEHQAGLALDIVDKSYQLLDEGQEDTAVQQWLMAHCAEYGFILRYPTDKSALTGVSYEPWHYRYVGTEAAREIMSRGLCLEEYLAET